MAPPHFNHIGLSVSSSILDDKGRADITSFYGEVFGWQEFPTETIPDKRLILSAGQIDQFVFLIADDKPLTCPRLDHFGMGVDTMEELDEMLAKAKAYKEKDDRVDIIDKKTDEHPGLNLTSFYVGYLLPLMVEVQHFDWRAGT